MNKYVQVRDYIYIPKLRYREYSRYRRSPRLEQ